MGFLVRAGVKDINAEIEKRSRYRFWDKERERSNHAVRIQEGEWRPACPGKHQRVAWSGPPHDIIETITCIDCGAFASKPEMADRGYDFNDCPDWIYLEIMDEKQARQRAGNMKMFSMRR